MVLEDVTELCAFHHIEFLLKLAWQLNLLAVTIAGQIRSFLKSYLMATIYAW